MFYTPNKVFRCADCARQAPPMRTTQDAKPGQCPNCFQNARELPITATVNGQEIDVCWTCGTPPANANIKGVTFRPAAKRTLFKD